MTKRYSAQFKQESIQYVQSHPELTIATIAQQLGVG
jgi:transposase-like protein